VGSLNKQLIIGNIGKDPEIRYTTGGLAVANFNVAANEKYKDKETTEWFNIVAYGKLAEICGEYLSKGQQVYIEGRTQTREYTDRDQNKRRITEVIADKLVMIGGGKGSQTNRPKQEPARQQTEDYGPPPGDDGLPF